MPSQPARKRRNARRTCTNCRVCKTRCELPDLSVPDSSAALPRHLKCHRCRALDVECVVNDCNLKRKRRSNATSATQSSALTADSLFPKPASSPSSFHNARHVQQNGGSYSDPQNDSLELHAHELVAIDPHPVIASVDSCPSSGQAADGVSPVSPQQRLKNPSHPPLVSHSVIRYLHRPLSSFSAALKWDPKYIAYAGHRLDPGHAPPQNVLHLVSEQLVEDLDEDFRPYRLWHPYLPPLQGLRRRILALHNRASNSIDLELLLTISVLLACRHSMSLTSLLARQLSSTIDHLSVQVLLAPPRSVETIMALLLIVSYDAELVGASTMRVSATSTSISGESALAVAISTAKALGLDSACRDDPFNPSFSSAMERPRTELDCSLWWQLCLWQAHMAFNNIPFRPVDLSSERQAAEQYLIMGFESRDALEEQPSLGHAALAHRILVMANIHASIAALQELKPKGPSGEHTPSEEGLQDVPPDVLHDLRPKVVSHLQSVERQQSKLELRREVLFRRLRSTLSSSSSTSNVLQNWIQIEQSALLSLFASKASCMGVTGATDLIVPIDTFIQSIQSDPFLAQWLVTPGSLRRQEAVRCLSIFAGLEPDEALTDGDLDSLPAQKGCIERLCVPITLTLALLLDSCRTLMEAEAYTIVAGSEMPRGIEVTTLIMRSLRTRLRKIDDNHFIDEAGEEVARSPVQVFARIIQTMLQTRSSWFHGRPAPHRAQGPNTPQEAVAEPVPEAQAEYPMEPFASASHDLAHHVPELFPSFVDFHQLFEHTAEYLGLPDWSATF